jgi:4-carboxymuconolactone decarboxylase
MLHLSVPAMIAPRIVPIGMYNRAVQLLRHEGLTDLRAVIVYFTIVSLTMTVYSVPADAVGLDR